MTTLDDSGRKVKAKNLPTEPTQIAQYFADLPGDHQAVVECTMGWYWLSDLCHDLGIDLILAHATHLKAIASAKVKTDTVDALTMAHVRRLVGTRSRLQTQAQAILLKGNHDRSQERYCGM